MSNDPARNRQGPEPPLGVAGDLLNQETVLAGPRNAAAGNVEDERNNETILFQEGGKNDVIDEQLGFESHFDFQEHLNLGGDEGDEELLDQGDDENNEDDRGQDEAAGGSGDETETDEENILTFIHKLFAP